MQTRVGQNSGRPWWLGSIVGALLLSLGRGGGGTAGVSATAAATPATAIPRPDHVVIVMEENHAYSEIIGSPQAPYINTLATAGAVFTNSHGVEHPSQPNYLDLFSGLNQGVSGDACPYTFTTGSLGSELISAGFGFTGYSEDLPAAGSPVCTAGAYARKHSPWINFSNLPTTTNQPLTTYPTDYSQLPTLSFVIPNLNNDMHDGTIAQGDSWLQAHIQGYAQWAQAHNSLLIVTWDEDDFSSSNQVATIFYGPMVLTGQYGELINHFNVLRTLEDMYGLPALGQSAGATPITDVWLGGSTPTVTATASSTPTATILASATPTILASATTTATPTLVSTLTATATPTLLSTLTATATPTLLSTLTATITPATGSATATHTPTLVPPTNTLTPSMATATVGSTTVPTLVASPTATTTAGTTVIPSATATLGIIASATTTRLPTTGTLTPPATPTSSPPATATPCAIRFTDVADSSAYYYQSVYYLACRGVISGYSDGTFKPFNNTTRAQMTKIVTLAFNIALVTPPAGGTFADVDSNSVFYQLIETAAAHQIVSGYTCGGVNPQTGANEPCDSARRPYFRPSNPVTRGQLTKIVVIGAGWDLHTPTGPTFNDVPAANVFYPFIETAVCHGIISGYNDGTFRPTANAFRSQIAKISYLAVTASAANCTP
ncbi:MAG: S-layer homology domain-containing protein [Chloroflexota bacterium]|nr:S-layer homology domain-containing protein [Chloroflexota bacterium]